MGLPNLNTNNNLKCSDGASFQGFIFDGSNNNPTMSIVQGASTQVEVSLKDVFMPASQYYTQDFLVKASGSVTMDCNNIANSFGEVQFLSVIVTYPTADINNTIIPTAQKFIKFDYPFAGISMGNIGKIMMLSGATADGAGWGFDSSPGGITFYNVHDNFDIKIKVLAFN